MADSKTKKAPVDWPRIRRILLTNMNEVLAYLFEVILLLTLITMSVQLLLADGWLDALTIGGRMLVAAILLHLSSRYTSGPSKPKETNP